MRSRVLRVLVIAALVGLFVGPAPTSASHLTGGAEVSIADVQQAEDSGTPGFDFVVEVHRSVAGALDPITVRYATSDGTATGGQDFRPVEDDEITIPPGSSREAIEILVHGDTDLENHETFQVHLVGVTSGDAEIVDGVATGTIWNDDDPRVSVSDGTGVESEGITFFVRLSHPTVHDVSVDVATREGTASAGDDYEAFEETVSFQPHAREQTVIVETFEDDEDEGEETFFVDLSDPANATLARSTGEGVIVDAAFDVDAGPAKDGESAAQVSFTGDAEGGTPPHTFTWDLGDGSATKTGKTIQHRFAETGSYRVTLKVEDSSGGLGIDTTRATITDSGRIERSFGSNREGTAIDVSRDHWDEAGTVVLATGYAHADALAAGPLAKKLDAPLLLTNPHGLPDEVKQELDRLGASEVIILGGVHAVPQSQADELAREGYRVRRIADINRFGTAADIATEVGATSNNEVTVSLGQHAEENRDDWPDALSAGSFASLAEPLPSLLTHSSTVPQETLDALAELDTEKVFLLGGSVAISDRVEEQLEAEGYEVQRVFGADRYGTSVAAGEIVMGRYPAGQHNPVLATGRKFPDGLTGGALAGKVRGPVVLVPPDNLDNAPGVVRGFLRKYADPFDVGTIAGGEAVVSETVSTQARDDIDTE